jgi:sialate O-acetylesterase
MRLLSYSALASALAATATSVGAQAPVAPLTVEPLVADNAVLQRDRPLTISGAASPGERISMILGKAVATGKADASGRWRIALPAHPAGGDYALTITGNPGRTLNARNLTFGDVWLCSGQSNMEWPVKQAYNPDKELAESTNAAIRLLSVAHDANPAQQTRFATPVAWTPATPASVAGFSAVCYFMARDLNQRLGVPMGLIHSSWGGSNIEGWISGPTLSTLKVHASDVALIGLFARDPAAAQAQMAAKWQDWWYASAGATSSPWLDDGGLSWSPVPQPWRDWKKWGVPATEKLHGMVWFDRSVALTAAQAAQGATLDLGPIDEVDQTWVNGKAIGNSFGWATERSYTLAPGTLKAGANRIALNIYSGWGMGGLFGPADKIALRLADGTKISLGDGWRYALPRTAMTSPPAAPWYSIGGKTGLYNAMIAPLGNYAIRGATWYQGESNTGNADQYATLLDTLKTSWRAQFGATMPFITVQLPNFGDPNTKPVTSGWSSVREAQRISSERDPNAGLAVAIDLGDASELHPPNKLPVGLRLARVARALVYGETITATGPRIAGVARRADAVVVSFKDVTGTLVTRSAAAPISFELCGPADASCSFADAKLINGEVLLSGPAAATATRVRHCWGDAPMCNLYDADLPVGPFEAAIGR